jgi:16S rRNA processing protein RimM
VNTIELKEVGFTKKPKGVNGHIKIHIDDNYVDDVSRARAIFIDINGSRVPFLIEKFLTDSHMMIKLEEVDSPQDAEQYSAKTVFLEVNEVTNIDGPDNSMHPLIGYAVIDQDNIRRGHISSVEEYPNQVMCFITNGDSTFMFPIHEDNIIETKKETEEIYLEIPEGLGDLYNN